MGGYERSTLKLKFDDEEFDGLIVRMKRLPIGDLFSVMELADVAQGGKDDLSVEESKAALDSVLDFLAPSIISWNLEENGKPVPTGKGTPAHKVEPGCCDIVVPDNGSVTRHPSTGLCSVDVDLIFAVIDAWVDAASGVSPPLPKNSNSGGLSPAESETMAALSESLGSLPMPA